MHLTPINNMPKSRRYTENVGTSNVSYANLGASNCIGRCWGVVVKMGGRSMTARPVFLLLTLCFIFKKIILGRMQIHRSM